MISQFTIHKFPIAIRSEQLILMPSDAHILHVDVQGTALCVWAMVNTKGRMGQRRFYVLATGEPANDVVLAGCPHLGTAQLNGFVWHVFDGGQR